MSNRISFTVDADSISLKSIYKKDFLELQMRAISTANPNLNGSWFTKESLVDSIDSFRNKPILGFFNADGDFESHNGTWRKDVETGLDYWDTNNGEQIIGIIRENDTVKVVDDIDGLSWLCLSCALWTQYNFKQVKRLIKDAKRAKENGGVTKNISVEIDIIEGEKQENGVYRIDKFKLAGITILGSRKGKKVLPGIADAALSIPEIMGSDFYAKQQNAIRAAYARLDNSNDGEKEDILNMMEPEKCENAPENIQNVENLENNTVDTATCEEQCTCAQGDSDKDHDQCDCGGGKPDVSDTSVSMTENCDCGDKSTVTEECGEEPSNADPESAEVACKMDNEPEKVFEASEPTVREVQDISWLISRMCYSFDDIKSTMDYYGFLMSEGSESDARAAYVLSVLKRVLDMEIRIQGTLGGLLNKIAGEISADDELYEAKLSKYGEVDELIENYEHLTTIVNELKDQNSLLKSEVDKYAKENAEVVSVLNQYKHNEFMAQVSSLLQTSKLDEKSAKSIYALCDSGVINTYDDAKTKVAIALFDAQQMSSNDTLSNIQTPVVMPNVQAAFEAKAEKSQKRDSWTIMQNYYGKK